MGLTIEWASRLYISMSCLILGLIVFNVIAATGHDHWTSLGGLFSYPEPVASRVMVGLALILHAACFLAEVFSVCVKNRHPRLIISLHLLAIAASVIGFVGCILSFTILPDSLVKGEEVQASFMGVLATLCFGLIWVLHTLMAALFDDCCLTANTFLGDFSRQDLARHTHSSVRHVDNWLPWKPGGSEGSPTPSPDLVSEMLYASKHLNATAAEVKKAVQAARKKEGGQPGRSADHPRASDPVERSSSADSQKLGEAAEAEPLTSNLEDIAEEGEATTSTESVENSDFDQASASGKALTTTKPAKTNSGPSGSRANPKVKDGASAHVSKSKQVQQTKTCSPGPKTIRDVDDKTRITRSNSKFSEKSKASTTDEKQAKVVEPPAVEEKRRNSKKGRFKNLDVSETNPSFISISSDEESSSPLEPKEPLAQSDSDEDAQGAQSEALLGAKARGEGARKAQGGGSRGKAQGGGKQQRKK